MHYDLALDTSSPTVIRSPFGSGDFEQALPEGMVLVIRPRDSGMEYRQAPVYVSHGEARQSQLEAAIKSLQLANATSMWRKRVFDIGGAADVDSLTETVDAVLSLVAEFGPTALSLEGLHPNLVHAEHLAALLRASSTWRNEIPGWQEALGVAEAAARRAELDPSDVLFGMI